MIKIRVRGVAALHAELYRLRGIDRDLFADPSPVQAIIASNVLETMVAGTDSDGTPWEPLSDSYQDWKDTVAPGAMMGYLYGTMTEDTNLRGIAVSAPDRMVITYGVDPEAIAHAVKFTFGGLVTGTNQPPRPFYGLSARAEAELHEHFKTVVQTIIEP